MSHHKKKHKFEMVRKDFDHGMRGVVSLVRRESDGELFVLKIPVDNNYENHRSFRSEIRKARLWRRLDISDIEVMWHPKDKTSLLKTFVKGSTLAQIEKSDPLFFSRENDHAVRRLGKMLKHLIDEMYYVGDLSTGNLIYDKKRGIWQVIDSGSVHQRSSRSTLKREYKEKLLGKWSRELNDNQEGINYLKSFLQKYCD